MSHTIEGTTCLHKAVPLVHVHVGDPPSDFVDWYWYVTPRICYHGFLDLPRDGVEKVLARFSFFGHEWDLTVGVGHSFQLTMASVDHSNNFRGTNRSFRWKCSLGVPGKVCV